MSKEVTAKPLILSSYADSGGAIEYTAPSDTKSIIDKFTATNVTGTGETIDIWLIPNGQTVGNEYKILDSFAIAANTCVDITELKNHVLDTGGYIYAQASAGSAIVIRCSGREVKTS